MSKLAGQTPFCPQSLRSVKTCPGTLMMKEKCERKKLLIVIYFA